MTDRAAWGALARDILAVPEAVLARRGAPVTDELQIACQRAGYGFGDLFIQVLQLVDEHRNVSGYHHGHRDCLGRLRGDLRARLTTDALPAALGDCGAVIDARKFLPARADQRAAESEAGYQRGADDPSTFMRKARAL